MVKGVLIKARGYKDGGQTLFKVAEYPSVIDTIFDITQFVHPVLLPKPYCLAVDDNGIAYDLQVNEVASILYGYINHGNLIVGDVVVFKDAIVNGQPDIVGLDEEDVEAIKYLLEMGFGAKEDSK